MFITVAQEAASKQPVLEVNVLVAGKIDECNDVSSFDKTSNITTEADHCQNSRYVT